MDTDFCIVLTTFSDDANARKIIDAILSERLAACAQVLPIQSFYHWKGKVNCDDEKLVLFKTRTSLYEKVEQLIVSHHAYETPEVIQVPVTDGFSGYLSWIEEECQC